MAKQGRVPTNYLQKYNQSPQKQMTEFRVVVCKKFSIFFILG